MARIKTLLVKRPILLITITVLVVLFISTLFIIPHGIAWGVKDWVREQGNDQVMVDNVDFNPFTGTLVIQGLQAERQGDVPLKVDELRLDMVIHRLFKRQVVVEGVTIKGVNLVIEKDVQQQWRIGGIGQADTSPHDKANQKQVPWGFAIDTLALEDVGIDYRTPELSSSLQVDSLELGNLASFMPDQQTTLRLGGQLDDASLEVSGQFSLFDEAELKQLHQLANRSTSFIIVAIQVPFL